MTGLGGEKNLSYIVNAFSPEVDLSGLSERPGDYNGDLESYIELKAPEPESSGLVTTTHFDDALVLKSDKSSLDIYTTATDSLS